jgi:DNA-directed RNA polymerase subunit H
MKKTNTTNHLLVPKHLKVKDKEKQIIYATYNITFKELPKMLKNDSAIKNLNVKQGDVIKIIRKSPTAGEFVFYRGVIDE